MNTLLNKLERKFGRYAIVNLSKYVIGCYILGYAIMIIGRITGTNLLGFFSLDPYKILHGQIWRLITWIIVPPQSIDLFTIIMLMLYYSLGTSLERTWGTFRFNIYIFSGMIFTIIGAFILYIICYFGNAPMDNIGLIISLSFSTYYVNMSIFLAFAAEYPDMQLLLFFIIPIKIKWLAIADVILLIYNIITSGFSVAIAIIASLLNFIIFFFGVRNYRSVSSFDMKRKHKFNNASNTHIKRVTKHKCAICGRTESDDEDLEFRFCSKCNGNYEYCQDHLFTHTHIK
ncbi:MAG: hypothetical protein K6E98_04845 [Lachnospiraceae bacterium]|nr:hypothetical protein [Lachnospiraceae bacterium]